MSTSRNTGGEGSSVPMHSPLLCSGSWCSIGDPLRVSYIECWSLLAGHIGHASRSWELRLPLSVRERRRSLRTDEERVNYGTDISKMHHTWESGMRRHEGQPQHRLVRCTGSLLTVTESDKTHLEVAAAALLLDTRSIQRSIDPQCLCVALGDDGPRHGIFAVLDNDFGCSRVGL